MKLSPLRFNEDERIDLHVHSHYSDGRYPPEVLSELAARNGLAGIALTDHATVDGIPEMIEAGARAGIHVIPGLELNADEADLLGLFIDYQDRQLLSFLESVRQKQLARIRAMVKNLETIGFGMKYTDLIDVAKPGIPTTDTLARVLVKRGFFPDEQTVFTFLLGPGAPAFSPEVKPTVESCVAAILDAGGVAIEAHPLQRCKDFSRKDLDAFYAGMKQWRLAGYEAMPAGLAIWCEPAAPGKAGMHRASLVAVGGSNFHGGSVTRTMLGDQTTAGDVLADLMMRLPSHCAHADLFEQIPWRFGNLSAAAFRDSLVPPEVRLDRLEMKNLLERRPAEVEMEKIEKAGFCVLIGPSALDIEDEIMTHFVQGGARIISVRKAGDYPEWFWDLGGYAMKPPHVKAEALLSLNVEHRCLGALDSGCRVALFECPAAIDAPTVQSHLQRELDVMRFFRVRHNGRTQFCKVPRVHVFEMVQATGVAENVEPAGHGLAVGAPVNGSIR